MKKYSNTKKKEALYNAYSNLKELITDFPEKPFISNLDKAQKSLLEQHILHLGNSLVNSGRRDLEFRETFRKIRNEKSAHEEVSKTDKELQEVVDEIWPQFPMIKRKLEKEVQKNLPSEKSKKKFASYGTKNAGNIIERNQLVDALSDSLNSNIKEKDKFEYPNTNYGNVVHQIMDEVVKKNKNQTFFQKHTKINENLQNDVIKWIGDCEKIIKENNLFQQEEVFVKEVCSHSEDDFVKRFDEIQNEYLNLKSVKKYPSKVDFNFMDNKIDELVKLLIENPSDNKTFRKLASYIKLFKNHFKRNLEDRRIKWQMEVIEEERKKFVKELLENIEKFKELERKLSPLYNNLGRLWDLSKTSFNDYGFEVIEQFAELLKNDKSLQELAKLLGKSNRAQVKYEKEIREKIVTKYDYVKQESYRGEISGIHLSNNIESIVPSELMLLMDEKTETLFGIKYVEKQLQCFKYENIIPTEYSEKQQETVKKKVQQERGPVIICVDTSGSMQGTPENIAKTVTFALSKIAIEENRKLYLISFSNGIETLDLSDFGSGLALENLVQFLRMSFNGGTDATPALNESLRKLNENNWNSADVLMVSDFCMGYLPENLVEQINLQKEKKTKFYSLVIGDAGNNNVIECFDENWSYNINDNNASEHLIHQLHKIKNSKNNTI